MKIAFINYCPKIQINGDQSTVKHNINNFLKPFKDSLIANSNEIFEINLNDMTINSCLGCTEDILFEPKPNCTQDDDMNSIYPILRESDLWIFAIKQNHIDIPEKVHNFLDRLEPLFNDVIDLQTLDVLDLNKPVNSNKKVFLMAFSEHWGKEVFRDLSYHIQSTAFLFNREFFGEFLRPHFTAFIEKYENDFSFTQEINSQFSKLALDLTYGQAIQNGYLNNLSREIISKDEFERNLKIALQKIK